MFPVERQNYGMELEQPDYISTAASMGLGTNDPDQIYVETLNLVGQAVSSTGKTITTWGAIKK